MPRGPTPRRPRASTTRSGSRPARTGPLRFTGSPANAIQRLATAGGVATATASGIDGPAGITAGPDGALWFTNNAGNSIGRITTSGTVTTYTAPGINGPLAITA